MIEKSILLKKGFLSDEQETLEEVGKKFKISRERVRQIEKGAISKIRKKFYKIEELKPSFNNF